MTDIHEHDDEANDNEKVWSRRDMIACPCCGNDRFMSVTLRGPIIMSDSPMPDPPRTTFEATAECDLCNLKITRIDADKDKAARLAIEAWNRREGEAGETKMIMHDGSPCCASCYGELDYDNRYCGWCGKKIAED